MAESSKFFRTSYKKGPLTNLKLTARSGSFQKTTDTDNNFEKTVSQFGKTKNQAFTSRLSHTSGQQTGRAEKTFQQSEFGITIYKPVAATDYRKRKVDPFVLSSQRQRNDFIEFTELSSGDKKPYKIGTRNFSHGEFINGSISDSKMDLGRINTEPKDQPVPHSFKVLSAQQNSFKKVQPNTFVNYVKPAQSSDLQMLETRKRDSLSQANLDQQ